jgi:hypothetical protein
VPLPAACCLLPVHGLPDPPATTHALTAPPPPRAPQVAGGFNGPCTRRRKLTKEQSLLGLGQGQGAAAQQQGAGLGRRLGGRRSRRRARGLQLRAPPT